MKKRITIILAVIFCTSTFSLHAGVRIGAKAGVNLANATFSTSVLETNNFTGFQVGPMIEISGLTGFGLDAAVLYSEQGVKFSGTSISALSGKSSTLDVPVNLKFKLPLANLLGIYLTAGPYISFKLDNQNTSSQDQALIKEEWMNKNFGVGLNFGAGFELFKHLQIGVNYQLALNDDYSTGIHFADYFGNLSSEIKGKTRIWSITAAYFF